jgi:prophage tail gpP-like protein
MADFEPELGYTFLFTPEFPPSTVNKLLVASHGSASAFVLTYSSEATSELTCKVVNGATESTSVVGSIHRLSPGNGSPELYVFAASEKLTRDLVCEVADLLVQQFRPDSVLVLDTVNESIY